MSVIWHDVECGGYAQDLSLWRSLAAQRGDPVLDVGAGTGRIALDLARHGHEVVALDHDPVLVAELARRAGDLSVTAITADARDFDLGRQFALCIVPMQTIQLLGGAGGRRAFLDCARRHLRPGALLAVAIAPELELFEVVDGGLAPLPDIREVDGVVYSSLPTAVRADPEGFLLERRRERISASGSRSVEQDVIRLDRLSGDELESEAGAVGLEPAGRAMVAATDDYVGSEVVLLRA
ncbi:MAG: class I SAM-dependent methyltransferase [Solirubrobacteraceae bacterium]